MDCRVASVARVRLPVWAHLGARLMPSLVSILIPAYNAAAWIGATLDSAR